MGRKCAVLVAVVGLLMGLAVAPVTADESAASAASLETDTVVTANLSGGCVGRHEGTGNNINIIVTAEVVAVGATSVSVTCHLWQGSPFYRHAHVGTISAVSAAAGGGTVSGFYLAPYSICAEIHASFTGGAPPYNKNCPTH